MAPNSEKLDKQALKEQPQTDTVQLLLWGKGVSVTKPSEEFQLLVPRKMDAPSRSPLEARLADFDNWAPILTRLQGASPSGIQAQAALLLEEGEFALVVLQPTVDPHQREAVLAAAFVGVRKPRGSVEKWYKVVDSSAKLLQRVSLAFAQAFRERGESVGRQLRSGTFIDSRAYQVPPADSIGEQWGPILRASANWSGISGFVTPALALLGGNILLGTRHEATSGDRNAFAGYFDVHSQQVIALTPGIKEIGPKAQAEAAKEGGAVQGKRRERKRPSESLQGIESALNRIAETLHDFFRTLGGGR